MFIDRMTHAHAAKNATTVLVEVVSNGNMVPQESGLRAEGSHTTCRNFIESLGMTNKSERDEA